MKLRVSSLLFVLVLALAPFGLQAQSRVTPGRVQQSRPSNPLAGTFTPRWTGNVAVSSAENPEVMFQAPWFEDALQDGRLVNLTFYSFSVEVGENESLVIDQVTPQGITEEFSEQFSGSIRESGITSQNGWYPASHLIIGQKIKQAGHTYQEVYIYPQLVSTDGSRVRKATSIDYRLGRRSGPGATRPEHRVNWSTRSVLDTAGWYKIPIVREGVYKLDFDYFQSMGVDPSSIDPRTIRIHGLPAGMLTQVAGDRPYDDLPELAIAVVGEGDGSFDNNDYVMFYAQPAHKWSWHETLGRFIHSFNIYSDTSFYFLNWGLGNAKRVPDQASEGAGTHTPAYAYHKNFYERELVNPLHSGRVWLGEIFDLTTSQTFTFGVPKMASGTTIDILVRACATSDAMSSFAFKEGNNTIGTMNITNTNSSASHSYVYRTAFKTMSVASSMVTDGALDLEMIYSKPLNTSEGYLDYIEVQYRRRLDVAGENYFSFDFADNTGPGQIFDINVANGSSSYTIWETSDPLNVKRRTYSLNGSTMSFGMNADSVRSLIAFNGSGLSVPAVAKPIARQNLHGLGQAEFVIVSHPDFAGAAEEIAQFHRDHDDIDVHVVTTTQVYNEFNAGKQDPAAIRDFLKMMYDRYLTTRQPLKYAMMFGDGSIDYKRRLTLNESSFVPSYQARRSERGTDSYTSDDFYGFLDDGEGFWPEGAGYTSGVQDILFWVEGDTGLIVNHGLDISVGRIPVSSVDEANYMAAKIINYATNPDGFGAWRNRVLLVADHKDSDGTTHISQADSYSDDIYNSNPCFNLEKIYLDNYQMVNTASGTRFPDAKDALINELNEGSLVVNYTGHGGEVGWSNSSILEVTDINKLENENRLPAYITATCEFGRWDDPSRRSGAEMLVMKEEGGSIAMLTTVRVVYSSPNYTMNTNIYKFLLKSDTASGRYYTLGEAFSMAKNISWGTNSTNNRNFTLLGDPALTLAFPDLNAVITKINGQAPVPSLIDSLATLSLVTVEGEVRDDQGNLMSNYYGDLDIVVYDKPTRFTTKRVPMSFYWQKNKIFVGSASVAAGHFTFQFVVPVDVSYETGTAKISLYVHNPARDGSGCYDNIYVGGLDSTSFTDNVGPILDLFMNDLKFVDGGMTGPDPVLIANVFDDNGINTVGTGIGHELTGVLDANESEVIVLNDYYSAKKDSYKEGTIRYPFKDLASGEHTLRVKVWDVANNSNEGEIRFIVADDAGMALGHVLNYPNPFTTNTRFFIEHNHNGSLLDIQVKIFTIGGHLVKTLEDNFFAEGNLYCELTWDGLDDYGDAIGRGVYVYQVMLRDKTTGENVSKFEKLVLLR